MTLEEFCQRIPPKQLHLLARQGHGKGCRPLSYSEIAARSGMARSTVIKLLGLPSWGDTGIQTIDKLMQGCGVNLWKTEVHRKLVRRGKLRHMDNANAAQRRMYARLLRPAEDSGTGHRNTGS